MTLTSFVEERGSICAPSELWVVRVDPDEELLVVLLLQKAVKLAHALLGWRRGLLVRLVVHQFSDGFEHELDS